VQSRGRLDAQASRPQHHVAAQPVERDQEEEAQAAERGQEPDACRERREGKDVEAEITREDRVRDSERSAVDHPEHDIPRRRGGQPGEQAQHQRHRQAQSRERRRDVEPRRRRPDVQHDRVGDEAALCGPEVEVEHAGGQPARHQEQQHPGSQLAREDDPVPDLAEPPPIRDQDVAGGQDEDHQEGGEQQDWREAVSEHGRLPGSGRGGGSSGTHPAQSARSIALRPGKSRQLDGGLASPGRRGTDDVA
jgi:hypothetical protein